jgi:hypothetical protein
MCHWYTPACEAAQEAWESTYGPLSPECRARLADLRVTHVQDTVGWCGFDAKGCATFTAADPASGFSESPVVVVALWASDPLDVMAHEALHHLHECAGMGWGGGQCWDPDAECPHVGEAWGALSDLQPGATPKDSQFPPVVQQD